MVIGTLAIVLGFPVLCIVLLWFTRIILEQIETMALVVRRSERAVRWLARAVEEEVRRRQVS